MSLDIIYLTLAVINWDDLSPFQIALVAVGPIWAIVTTAFYLGSGALEKEPRSSGYILFRKYTPKWWQKTTLLGVPIWIVLVILSL